MEEFDCPYCDNDVPIDDYVLDDGVEIDCPHCGRRIRLEADYVSVGNWYHAWVPA